MSSAFQNLALVVLLGLAGAPLLLDGESAPTQLESTSPDPVPATTPDTTTMAPGGVALAAEPTADLAPGIADRTPTQPPSPGVDQPRLRRGMNIAGDFEVAPRGEWGAPILASDFADIAAQGFDHVRVPIRWSAHTGPAPEHTIDPAFAGEVDELVRLARANGLAIVLDVHFFEELDADPIGERDHFFAIWDQLADRYREEPHDVVFELLNEPVGVFDERPDLWNELAADAVRRIRQTNPERTIIIGPVSYNHASRLPDLELPADPNIVATIHTYDPADFTHQGAVWVDPLPPTGIVWNPDDAALAHDWVDLSWGTERTPTTDTGRPAMTVRFDEDWTALALGADQPRPHDRLMIELDRALDAVILCNFDLPNAQIIDLPTTAEATVDLTSCGDVERLAIQAVSGATTVRIDRLALCTGDRCDELIVTNADAIENLIGGAAAWAAARGVGLYIGEFGTLSVDGDPTDPASRTAWTRTVRQAAEAHDAGWAYFTLNDEMGARRGPGDWRPEIMTALFH